MKEEMIFTYQCHYAVAEFGEINVSVKAHNREEADQKIGEWCKENNCCGFSRYPSPQYICTSQLPTAKDIGLLYKSLYNNFHSRKKVPLQDAQRARFNMLKVDL